MMPCAGSLSSSKTLAKPEASITTSNANKTSSLSEERSKTKYLQPLKEELYLQKLYDRQSYLIDVILVEKLGFSVEEHQDGAQTSYHLVYNGKFYSLPSCGIPNRERLTEKELWDLVLWMRYWHVSEDYLAGLNNGSLPSLDDEEIKSILISQCWLSFVPENENFFHPEGYYSFFGLEKVRQYIRENGVDDFPGGMRLDSHIKASLCVWAARSTAPLPDYVHVNADSFAEAGKNAPVVGDQTIKLTPLQPRHKKPSEAKAAKIILKAEARFSHNQEPELPSKTSSRSTISVEKPRNEQLTPLDRERRLSDIRSHVKPYIYEQILGEKLKYEGEKALLVASGIPRHDLLTQKELSDLQLWVKYYHVPDYALNGLLQGRLPRLSKDATKSFLLTHCQLSLSEAGTYSDSSGCCIGGLKQVRTHIRMHGIDSLSEKLRGVISHAKASVSVWAARSKEPLPDFVGQTGLGHKKRPATTTKEMTRRVKPHLANDQGAQCAADQDGTTTEEDSMDSTISVDTKIAELRHSKKKAIEKEQEAARRYEQAKKEMALADKNRKNAEQQRKSAEDELQMWLEVKNKVARRDTLLQKLEIEADSFCDDSKESQSVETRLELLNSQIEDLEKKVKEEKDRYLTQQAKLRKEQARLHDEGVKLAAEQARVQARLDTLNQ